MNDNVSPQSIADKDNAWEPEGPLGHDPLYAMAAPADPETERAIDAALGFKIRLRRWLRNCWV